jgi:hypothetical protein
MRTDGRTDKTKLTGACREYVNASKSLYSPDNYYRDGVCLLRGTNRAFTYNSS